MSLQNSLVRLFLFISIASLFSESLGVKPTCKVCKEFVESFEKRLEDTAKSNYAGGDTHWEEEKLGSYANSEVRLIEMLDSVCRHSDYECHRLLENSEEDIERWWFKLRHNEGNGDLHTWLCLIHLDVCCPPNTFGPTCTECPGGVETPCGGHGKCQGSEEKTGKGECSCDAGYDGVTCQSCDRTYYTDSDSGECKSCDKACKDTCEGQGPEGCEECASGYEEIEDTCKDVDECKDDDSICRDGTYCLNTPGSHRCQPCDKSCTVCNGPGPSKCGDCSKGYLRGDNGNCQDIDECEVEDLCSSGTYCENTPGSHACKACHIACLLTCTGPGPESCDECKSGYRMEDDACVDIDECSNTPGPCDPETETCSNLAGTFSCECNQGLVRNQDNKCIQAPKKKKKKSKKGKKKRSSADDGEKLREREDSRTEILPPNAKLVQPVENLDNKQAVDPIKQTLDEVDDDKSSEERVNDSQSTVRGNEDAPEIISSEMSPGSERDEL